MPHKTKLVAIINVTPDSFSDGGQYASADAAVAAIAQATHDGADVIDIGAESTRPGAVPVSLEEECRRLQPVLESLKRFRGVLFSLDTRHGETVKRALPYGIDWINDVSGFASIDMVQAVAASDCKLVVMHSLSVPADKSVVLPPDCDPVHELLAFAKARFAALEQSGIARTRLLFDPGIGFGKTPEQSIEILKRAEEFAVLGVPVFIGHSRKSFLGQPENRDAATLAVSRTLAAKGVDYLRVHNVKLHRSMLEEMVAHA